MSTIFCITDQDARDFRRLHRDQQYHGVCTQCGVHIVDYCLHELNRRVCNSKQGLRVQLPADHDVFRRVSGSSGGLK